MNTWTHWTLTHIGHIQTPVCVWTLHCPSLTLIKENLVNFFLQIMQDCTEMFANFVWLMLYVCASTLHLNEKFWKEIMYFVEYLKILTKVHHYEPPLSVQNCCITLIICRHKLGTRQQLLSQHQSILHPLLLTITQSGISSVTTDSKLLNSIKSGLGSSK